jgi:toxin ParE1/3/4
MSRHLVISPAAEDDILDAYSWCEERVTGLGSRLLEELERVFNRFVINPDSYREVAPGIRRAIARTFPYLAFYTFDDEAVYVLAIIHASQNPAYIAARLRA